MPGRIKIDRVLLFLNINHSFLQKREVSAAVFPRPNTQTRESNPVSSSPIFHTVNYLLSKPERCPLPITAINIPSPGSPLLCIGIPVGVIACQYILRGSYRLPAWPVRHSPWTGWNKGDSEEYLFSRFHQSGYIPNTAQFHFHTIYCRNALSASYNTLSSLPSIPVLPRSVRQIRFLAAYRNHEACGRFRIGDGIRRIRSRDGKKPILSSSSSDSASLVNSA